MNSQKRDLIRASQHVTEATGEQPECECGRPVAPFSCYCVECEVEIRAEEAALSLTYTPGSGNYNDAMYGDY